MGRAYLMGSLDSHQASLHQPPIINTVYEAETSHSWHRAEQKPLLRRKGNDQKAQKATTRVWKFDQGV